MSEEVKQRLQLAIKILGTSGADLAKRAGVATSTLSRHISGTATTKIKQDTLDKVDEAVATHINSGHAEAEQIDAFLNEYLTAYPSAGSQVPANPINPVKPVQEVMYAPGITPRPLEHFHQGPKDIPVRGTAAGSLFGAMQIDSDGDPVEFVRRPPSLESAKNAFAIYVKGDSMSPQYNPGDLCYVHPDRHAQPGDAVIIETYNPGTKEKEAFIKILVSRKGNVITCKQHNPEATIDFIEPNGKAPEKTDKYAISVFKVLTVNELLGF